MHVQLVRGSEFRSAVLVSDREGVQNSDRFHLQAHAACCGPWPWIFVTTRFGPCKLCFLFLCWWLTGSVQAPPSTRRRSGDGEQQRAIVRARRGVAVAKLEPASPQGRTGAETRHGAAGLVGA